MMRGRSCCPAGGGCCRNWYDKKKKNRVYIFIKNLYRAWYMLSIKVKCIDLLNSQSSVSYFGMGARCASGVSSCSWQPPGGAATIPLEEDVARTDVTKNKIVYIVIKNIYRASHMLSISGTLDLWFSSSAFGRGTLPVCFVDINLSNDPEER